jgi:hypothetical protein
MSIEADIAAFVARLDSAIDSAMQGPVLDGAKKQIQDTARSRVYSAYQPQFYSRRMMSGGLMDEGNMKDSYGDKTLLIQNMTGWQHLYGGEYPGEMLVEAIANGDAAYHFQNAGARSFMPEAEQEFKPEFERILGDALRAAGF